MNSKVDLSSIQETFYAVAICGGYGDDDKLFGPSDSDVDHPFGLVIGTVLPCAEKLLCTPRFPEIRRDDDADGVVFLALRFVDSGTPPPPERFPAMRSRCQSASTRF